MAIPFHDQLGKRLDDIVKELCINLALNPSTDYGDYRERAGIIAGVRKAMEESDILETQAMAR